MPIYLIIQQTKTNHREGEMKAIKDCEWIIKITNSDNGYFQAVATTDEFTGLKQETFRGRHYSTREMVEEKFKEFAELNGITKYKFVD